MRGYKDKNLVKFEPSTRTQLPKLAKKKKKEMTLTFYSLGKKKLRGKNLFLIE